jgi:ABC-type Mn2+/Zn2+ transport system permease subunit
VVMVFWLAPCLAVSTSVVGFVIANHWDYPPAQMTIALLSLMLMLTWGRRRWRGRTAVMRSGSPPAGPYKAVQTAGT